MQFYRGVILSREDGEGPGAETSGSFAAPSLRSGRLRMTSVAFAPAPPRAARGHAHAGSCPSGESALLVARTVDRRQAKDRGPIARQRALDENLVVVLEQRIGQDAAIRIQPLAKRRVLGQRDWIGRC